MSANKLHPDKHRLDAMADATKQKMARVFKQLEKNKIPARFLVADTMHSRDIYNDQLLPKQTIPVLQRVCKVYDKGNMEHNRIITITLPQNQKPFTLVGKVTGTVISWSGSKLSIGRPNHNGR